MPVKHHVSRLPEEAEFKEAVEGGMVADASLESPASASLACVCLPLSAQISSQEPGHA